MCYEKITVKKGNYPEFGYAYTATCTVIGDSGGTNCGSCTTCPTRQIVCPTRQEDCPTKVNCQTKLLATCQCDMESVNKKCDGVVIEPSW